MILVTGASGFLGSNLVVSLLSGGRPVVALSRREPLKAAGLEMGTGDLSNGAFLGEYLDRWNPSWIVHCAADSNVDWCEGHPLDAWRDNVEATAILSKAALARDIRVLYISTDSVFDGTGGPYREEDDPHPLNVYARTKLEGERVVLSSSQENVVVRTNFYGWSSQVKRTMAEWMCRQLEDGNSFPGFQDVLFCPLLVNDLCLILSRMIDASLSGLYHVVGAQPCSKYEFGRMIADTFGWKKDLVKPSRLSDTPLPAARPLKLWLKTEKIMGVLGPLPGVTDGLRRFKELRQVGHVTKLKELLGRGDRGAISS